MAKPSPKHAGWPELIALGASIRSNRQKLQISQDDLAMAADVDRSYLGGIERGEHNPTFMTLWRVARALEVPLSRLVKDADL